MRASGRRVFYGPAAGYNVGMKLISGRVTGGKVELPPGILEEGEPVAILAMGDDEPVALSEGDRRELADRAQAIARGEFVDGDQFIKEIKARRRA